MLKYERLGLADTIEKFLSIKQKENAKSIRKAVKRKKRKDLSIGDRIHAIFHLHFCKSRAIDIADLVTSFKEVNTFDSLYIIPQELKQDIEYVGANITSADFNELSTAINYALIQSQDATRRDFQRKKDKLFKSLKKSKLETKYITYWEDGKAINASLEAGILHLSNQKLTDINQAEHTGIVRFDSIAVEELPLSEEESYLVDIEDMVRKGELAESDITKNIAEIREYFRKRIRLEDLSSRIWKVICTLQKEGKTNGVDFSRANKILQEIYNKCRKQIDSCDAYLSKFDFATLQEKVIWVREKREQEEWTRNHLEALNQVSQITPRSPQVIQQIKKSNKVTMEAKHDLRHLAIQELQQSGELEPIHQHVGGIVLPSVVSEEEQESMIRSKIEEMISIASQTPEQRAVSYMKSMGIAVKDTPVEETSTGQLADFSSSFGDDSYTFDIARIRQIKELIDSQRREKATSICKEYIRYRAALKDKKSAVTFSEYARTLYLQENMDLSMVDESVRDNEIMEVSEETRRVR